ncbi:hypothetical protein QYF61_018431 [Mycteria americana]|uniref:ribonuclease H n=1 Tax=Mycteria americana TaxID=33587 RepID=A0AAN7MIH7_MYCAM|nr:hypothetical protein QYF61_018431 [Mycteria americana]
MEKATLEQVHLKATVAVDKSMPQQRTVVKTGTQTTIEDSVIETGIQTTSKKMIVETGAQTASEDTMAEMGTQMPTTVIAPVVRKKQWTRRSTGPYHQLLRGKEEEGFDQEAGPSTKKWEEEVREIREEAETTRSLTLREVRDMRKDYSRQPGYRGTEPIWISGVTGGSQQLSVLKAEVSLTGDKWQKHPIVTGPEAPSTVNTEKIKQLSTLPGLSEDPSVVGLLRVEEQQVPIATRTRVKVNSRLSWPEQSHATSECCWIRHAGTPKLNGVKGCQVGRKHSPTICHRLIQTALEQGDAPEHLQYINDIIVWGNKAEEVFEKGKRIIQILLQACFTIKQSKVKGPAEEIQFLGIKWQDGCHQIPMDVINKITS